MWSMRRHTHSPRFVEIWTALLAPTLLVACQFAHRRQTKLLCACPGASSLRRGSPAAGPPSRGPAAPSPGPTSDGSGSKGMGALWIGKVPVVEYKMDGDLAL